MVALPALHMPALCVCACVRVYQLGVSFFAMSSDMLPKACSFPSPVHPTLLTFSPCSLLPHPMLSYTLKTLRQSETLTDLSDEVSLGKSPIGLRRRWRRMHADRLYSVCTYGVKDRQRERETRSHSQLPRSAFLLLLGCYGNGSLRGGLAISFRV